MANESQDSPDLLPEKAIWIKKTIEVESSQEKALMTWVEKRGILQRTAIYEGIQLWLKEQERRFGK